MKQIIAVIFLVFVVIIGFNIIAYTDPNNQVSTTSVVEEISSSEEEIMVSVIISGEVEKPGTYQTTQGYFLEDIIAKAGGVTDVADETCFDYYLLVNSDMSIYIPPISDVIKVSINEANEEELTTLSGIGYTLASRIITYRNEKGDFLYLEQIMEVEGIGKAIFFKIRDYICL